MNTISPIADYDIDRLCRIVHHLMQVYGVEVYLELGEAIVLNSGFLVTTVLDVVHNGIDIAILDASVVFHKPDVLKMSCRPPTPSGQPSDIRGHGDLFHGQEQHL